MPGIDKTRFVNFGENELELLCGICLSVFVNPMVTQCCRQTYCSECIHQWLENSNTCPNDRSRLTDKKLTQPPRVLINLLNKLKVKCDFHANGCAEEITYGRYKHHLIVCRYNPEGICGDCAELNGQRSEHNCVEILLAKNRSLELSNKGLAEKNERNEEEIRYLNGELNEKDLSIKNLTEETEIMKREKHAIKQKLKNLASVKQQIREMGTALTKLDQSLDTCVEELRESTEQTNFRKVFQLKIQNIDAFAALKLIDGPVVYMNGLKWNIRAKWVFDKNLEYLGFYLVCNNAVESLMRSCVVNVELSIIPQTQTAFEKYSRKYVHEYFTTTDYSYGFRKFIPLSQVLDHNNGYVKDNAVILEVDLSSGSHYDLQTN